MSGQKKFSLYAHDDPEAEKILKWARNLFSGGKIEEEEKERKRTKVTNKLRRRKKRHNAEKISGGKTPKLREASEDPGEPLASSTQQDLVSERGNKLLRHLSQCNPVALQTEKLDENDVALVFVTFQALNRRWKNGWLGVRAR